VGKEEGSPREFPELRVLEFAVAHSFAPFTVPPNSSHLQKGGPRSDLQRMLGMTAKSDSALATLKQGEAAPAEKAFGQLPGGAPPGGMCHQPLRKKPTLCDNDGLPL
jgi:hypothetical protein